MNALERADAALEASDWPTALTHLLAAWRAQRSPRIADVIDRVSARLAAAPITGKTVAARNETWLALAKERDPANLARLLATPWPAKWQEWVPFLAELKEYPADPRLPVTFAKLVAETPFSSWKSLGLYSSFLEIIRNAADLRALPILEADLAKEKSREWNTRVRPWVVETVTYLRARTPVVLPADDEARLVTIEARFAVETQATKTAVKSEAELLAAIHANPDDDGARAVYADFLLERGNPLGEFITLQLEPNPNAAAKKRMATLLRKHEKTWAGPLHRLLSKEDRTFTRGFLSGGHLLTLSYRRPERAEQLRAKEWALFDTLLNNYQSEQILEEIFEQPWGKNLRVLRNLDANATMAALKQGLAPRLIELHINLFNSSEEIAKALARRLSANGALPRLERLGVNGDFVAGSRGTSIEQFLVALERPLARLWVTDSDLPLATIVATVQQARREVKVVETTTDFYAGKYPWWWLEAHADARRRFTKVRVRSTMPEKPIVRGEDRLAAALVACAAFAPTELEFDAPWELTEAQLDVVRAAVKAIPSLTRVTGL